MRGLVNLVCVSSIACACAGNGHSPEAVPRAEPREEPAPIAPPAPESEDPIAEQVAPPSEPVDPRVRPCPESIPEDLACIPAGSFVRGSDEGPENERPAAPIFVSSFLLEKREVTNAQYTECVNANVCQRLVRFPGYMGATQPAVGMRWDDADAYCRWRERRLPTEAEWERAASGPDDTTYPWGDEIEGDPCERAIVLVRRGRGCGNETTWPVGSLAPNAWGLYDMAGNVWEWVADHYSSCYRGCDHECGDACFTDDPRGLCGDSHAECREARGHRIVRGGSWWYEIGRADVSERRGAPGANPNPHRFGFRCAMDISDGAP
jgi:formylglycine-generating enzyme